MERVTKYFDNYNEKTAQEALGAKHPPAPLYTLPEWRSFKLLAMDAALVALPLAFVYKVAAPRINKHLSKPLPMIPSRVFVGMGCSAAVVGSYRIAQAIVVYALIHPVAFPLLNVRGLETARKAFANNGQQAMRFSVQAKGNRVDGVIARNKDTDLSGRWVIFSIGNCAYYESCFVLINIAKKLKANALFYNHPGVGRSGGIFASREVMAAAHRGMRMFLQNEMKAKEIVSFNWSVGAGPGSQDFLEKPAQDASATKYVSIYYKTFASISAVGEWRLGSVGKFGVKLLDWNYNVEKQVRESNHPVVVVQCASGRDNIIPDQAGLNAALQNNKPSHVTFITGRPGHNNLPWGTELDGIADAVNKAFSEA